MKTKVKHTSKFSSFIIKLFIHDKRGVNNINVRKKYSYLASIYALITNIILFSLKFAFSFVFNLDTLRADAINNASDIGMCILAITITAIASKPASSKHPYGSSRFEYIGSLIIAMVVMLIAASQIIENVQEMITNPEWYIYPPEGSGITNSFEAFSQPFFYIPLSIMILAVILKISQFVLLTDIGRITSSMSLQATGKDARNDSIVSFVIGISLIISPLCGKNIDSITSILVSLIVCLSGLNIAKDAADAILGKMPSSEIIKTFITTLKEYPIVLGYHDLEMNTYGHNSIHAYIHVEVDASLPLITIRNEIDYMEKDIEMRTGIRTVVHIDPILTTDPLTLRYKSYVVQAAHEIDSDIAVNDFSIITDSKNNKNKLLIFDLVLPYDLLSKDTEVIDKLKEIVRSFTNDNLTFRIDIDDRSADLLLLLKDNNKL